MPGVEAEQRGVEPEAGGPRLLGLGLHGDQDGGVWCCDAAAALLYTGHTCPSTAQHQCPGQLESRSSTDLQFLLRRSVMLHMLG